MTHVLNEIHTFTFPDVLPETVRDYSGPWDLRESFVVFICPKNLKRDGTGKTVKPRRIPEEESYKTLDISVYVSYCLCLFQFMYLLVIIFKY